MANYQVITYLYSCINHLIFTRHFHKPLMLYLVFTLVFLEEIKLQYPKLHNRTNINFGDTFFPSLLFWPRHKTRPLMLNCCHLTFVCMHRDQRVRSCRVIWLKLKSEGKWVCFHQIRSMHSTMWSKYFLSCSNCLIIIKIRLDVIIYEFYYFLNREVQKVQEIQEVHNI